MLKKNLHLRKLTRSRILEKRDLKNGIRLDRNEKVDNWDKQEIINLIKKQPDSFFSTYPNILSLPRWQDKNYNNHGKKQSMEQDYYITPNSWYLINFVFS